MQDSGSSFLGSIGTAWESYGEFLQLVLALLFGWLVLNWLSTTTARVDGLSMALADLRRDLEKLKEGGKGPHGSPKDNDTAQG